MSSSSIYLLDSSVFIEGKKHYPQTLFPSYWAWISEQAALGKMLSVKACYDEISGGNDGLEKWIDDNCPLEFILETDNHAPTIQRFADLQNWAATNPAYDPIAIHEFAAKPADATQIAAAWALGPNYTVVTYEKPGKNSRNRIKIPDVCGVHGVRCSDIFGMMTEIGKTI